MTKNILRGLSVKQKVFCLSFCLTKIIIILVMKNDGQTEVRKSEKSILALRLTDKELAEIENLAKKLKISKSEAVLRGIKLLKNPPRQIIMRSQMPGFVQKKNSKTF